MTLDPIRLLIVEDDPDQRDLIEQKLVGHFGAGTVVGASSIADAMDQDLESFDLILADYNLPDGTGMQLLERIKRISSTPVILVTGENVGRTAAEAIQRGATDYVVKLGDYVYTIPLVVEKNLIVARIKRENESLRGELEATLNELKSKNVQLEQSLKKVEEVAATDPLTGLYNRRHFEKLHDQLFSEAHRYDTDLTAVMIDLDGYKQLNDTFGHQVGDQVLIAAAKAIRTNLRRMDVAARYGGDEFVLLLPRAGSQEALGVTQRIREDFSKASAALLQRTDGVGMSIGLGSLSSDRVTGTEQLIARADAALYRAKAAGRNRTVASEPANPGPLVRC